MIFIPRFPILAALFSSFALPIFLAILSHTPLKISGLGKRFIFASLLSIGLWSGLSLISISQSLQSVGTSQLVADLLAGILILATASLCVFTFWTLIAWGFTLSMLMRLTDIQQPLTFEEWVAAYTGGQTLNTFTLDRLSVLFRFGWAKQKNDRVFIVRDRGIPIVRLTRWLRFMFGLE
ncbi:hypothetical protein IQ249_13280 [Lusitaniella coriacea LEGE 07157]|uniref:Uncharacterized protein n=1 Tax=Lusitaniella coriacea LEGE 07157 TaxID=945747 RepID=A0A8J7DXB9_9CYAN|nr:hypothetical protein [Lusitaniella coriacea]MBE9116873.1 hypothetical protein [Lusitaniella coriacea LEGE 07157]